MKTILHTLFCILGLSAQNFAQDVSLYIPKTSGTIISLNAHRLSSKINIEDIFRLPSFKLIDDQIKSLLPGQYSLLSSIYKNPSAVGLNVFPQHYLVFEPISDTLNAYSWLINMSDAKKFEEAIEKTLMLFSSTGKIEQGNGFKYIYKDYTGLGWNKRGMILLNVVPVNENIIFEGLNKEADDFYDIVGDRKDKLRRRQLVVMKEKMTEMFRQSESESILGDVNYQLFKLETADVGTWVASDRVNKTAVNAAQANPNIPKTSYNLKAANSQQEKYLSGSYFHVLTNFEKGEIKSIQRQYVNGELSKVVANAYPRKVNPTFFEYVNGQALLGFVSFAVDYQQFYQVVNQIYAPVFGNDGIYTLLGESVFNFLENTFKTRNLSEVFAGDINIAITGAKIAESTYTDYVFDSDYNSKAVIKTKTDAIPLFLAMITTTHKENAQKLLNSMVDNQIATKPTDKGLYMFINQEYIKDTYAFAKDNLVFITNEPKLNENQVFQNVSQVRPELKENAQKNNLMMLAEMKNILLLASKTYQNENVGYAKILEMLSGELKSVELNGTEIRGDTYTTNAVLLFNDKSRNSFLKIFELADKAMSIQVK